MQMSIGEWTQVWFGNIYGVAIWRGAGGIWEISVPSSQFCCVPSTVIFKCLKKERLRNVINVKEKFR